MYQYNLMLTSLLHTFHRYRTLQTDKIRALPIVILMPHSACNCKCIMCDIWKGNTNLQQLTEKDISSLLYSLKKLGTRQVVMSGGEALLNPNFFKFCKMMKEAGIEVTLLSTGLSLKKHAASLVTSVHDIIVSLDGDEAVHDTIRNIPGAFYKLTEGVRHIKLLDPLLRVTARCVIHQLNFRHWPSIIDSAQAIGLNQVSFLPADVSSAAFNREVPWDVNRQQQILISKEALPELKSIIDGIIYNYKVAFTSKFIAESPEKLLKIYAYYAAFYGLNPFPYKKCNAPWVSTVIEADGTVKPCFFHEPIGNIRTASLNDILNNPKALNFRKTLNTDTNSTCVKCVCYLNLSPGTNLVKQS